MTTKVIGLHHVSRTPRLPVGPDVECRVTPDDLAAALTAHRDWTFIDYARGLGRDAPERALVITFDDGYADFLTDALPVLEAFDAPCILFVVPGYLDRTVRPMESDVAWIAAHRDKAEREAFYDRTHRSLRARRPAAQRAALAALAADNGAPYPPPPPPPGDDDLLLDWDQVAALAEHPLVTIGSHTASHAQLGRLALRRAAREASESRARLEEVLRRPIECFAFPYGRHGFLPCRGVARAGYRFAFTTRPRLIDRPDRVDSLAVPRFMADGPDGWGPTLPARTRAA